MTDLREYLAERVRLRAAAPPAPWTYKEGADGDPTGGPTYTALTSIHPETGEPCEIARGDYDAWCGLGLGAAEDAYNAQPKLVTALEAVLDATDDHYLHNLRREAKFGRTGSTCVCEICQFRTKLDELFREE